jgi:transcriptional regulator with XRE-family HTH domain
MSKRGAIFMNGNGNQEILTMREVAVVLRCSKAHVSKLLNGKVPGVPPLTHMAIGRRKVTRRDWLQTWMEGYKQC